MEDVVCNVSKEIFHVRGEDIAFYKKIGVPSPKISPRERARKRLSFRNESSLHRRQCSGTGGSIISMYAPDCPIPIYENSFWWGDGWNAMTYGRGFDFQKGFFEQFRDLLYAVPKMARIQQGENINSRYCNCASYNRDCHLIFSSNKNENCMYGRLLLDCKNCIDCLALSRSELCYECIQCEDCYGSAFLQNCKNCSLSYFLVNCIGCQNCFGCFEISNKRFCLFNEQYSPDEYNKKIATLDLRDACYLERFKDQFEQYKSQFPIEPYRGIRIENVTGSYLTNSKDLFECFELDNCEECAYCNSASCLKTSYDVSFYGATGTNELLYECEGVGHGVTDVLCSKLIWGGSSNIRYSYECFNSKNLFGCCGLKKAKNCIFNKQYTVEEYDRLAAKVKNHMIETGEWGSFFPMQMSPFVYNESVAHLYFPLTEDEVHHRGLRWRTEISNEKFRIEQGEKGLLQFLKIGEPTLPPQERARARHNKRVYR